jgi:membrane protein
MNAEEEFGGNDQSGVEPVTTRSIKELIRGTVANWNGINEPRLSAALTFYTMISVAPLLVVSIALAGFAFGSQAAQQHVVRQIHALVGTEGSLAVKAMLQHANKPQGIIAGTLAIITFFVGASDVFVELRDDLNLIWGVAQPCTSGLKEVLRRHFVPLAIVRERFVPFAMVVGIGFLLMGSLLVSTAIEAMGKFFDGYLPIPGPVLELIDVLLSIIAITLLFAAMYKIVPDRHIEWRDVWIGAAVTSVLFSLGKLLIGVYLGRTGAGSAYGAAGSLVVFLLWVYYSAQIFFFGAEFTHAFAQRHGSLARPGTI